MKNRFTRLSRYRPSFVSAARVLVTQKEHNNRSIPTLSVRARQVFFLAFCLLFFQFSFSQYAFTWNGMKPATAYSYSNANNITIQNQSFIGRGLTLYNCSNVTIQNCYFEGGGQEIDVETGNNITFINNLFANYNQGIYCNQASGGINILYNQFINCTKPSGSNQGQHTQFNTCTDVNGPNKVMYNIEENFYSESNGEDLNSCYNSTG